jgi:hypothetical protein
MNRWLLTLLVSPTLFGSLMSLRVLASQVPLKLAKHRVNRLMCLAACDDRLTLSV